MKLIQRQREKCRMIGMRCKYYKGYYKGIEKRGSKYIRKKLSKREIERNNRKKSSKDG